MTSSPQADVESTSEGRAGRADEGTFAEALQAVDELQSVNQFAGQVTGVTDRIEGMLLEQLEAADALEVVDEDAASTDDGHTDVEAGSMVSTVVGYDRLDVSSGNNHLCRFWKSGPSWLSAELQRSVAAMPLLLVVIVDTSEQPEQREQHEQHVQRSFEHTLRAELLALLAYTYIAARLITLTLEGVATVLLQYRPIFDRLALAARGSFGWPATTLVWLLFNLLLGLPAAFSELPHFWPVFVWHVGAAVSRPIVDVVVKFHINTLTLRHYEQRAAEAHKAQTVLRGIVAAARAAQREMKEAEVQAQKRREQPIRQPIPSGTALSRSTGYLQTGSISARADLSSTTESLPLRPPLQEGVAEGAHSEDEPQEPPARIQTWVWTLERSQPARI